MSNYSEECLRVFLRDQKQLFDEPVAETMEEAEAFLEDCMAVVADSIDEVREYLKKKAWTWTGWARTSWRRLRKCSPFRTENISL